jgi:hypothetical protein
MNADIDVGFWKDGDGEKAKITIRSLGSVEELTFKDSQLNAVASLGPADFLRILEALRIAENKRVDPDTKLVAAVEYLEERFDIGDEEQNRLWIDWSLVMPIASSGSVKLVPNFEEPEEDAQATEPWN